MRIFVPVAPADKLIVTGDFSRSPAFGCEATISAETLADLARPFARHLG